MIDNGRKHHSSLGHVNAKELKASLSNDFLLLFLAFSMLGSIKVYIGGNLNWLIAVLLLAVALFCIIGREPRAQFRQRLSISIKSYYPMLFGWFLFMTGIAIAAFMNNGAGLYTNAKYAAMIFVLLMLLSVNVAASQLENGLILALALALIPLLFCAIFRKNDWLVISADNRMGWLAIWPGVLWKTGGYIWPLAMWRFLKKMDYKNLLLVFAAILAIALDGSRTGMLWLLLAFISHFILCLRLKKKDNLVCKHLILVIIAVFTFGVLQPVIKNWVPSGRIILHQEASTGQRLLLPENKSARLEMLRVGWKQAIDKFPWGAGFGKTGIWRGNQYLPIHMTYLQIICDEGILSLAGYLLFLGFPLYRGIKYLAGKRDQFVEELELLLVPITVLLLYLFSGCFHPVSNELTEWAVVLSAISIIMSRVTHRY